MAKNLIPQIAQMLGVELGEEFKIDTSGDDIFQITESGVWMRKGIDKGDWVEKPFEFVMLCNGDAEIIRLPWKPKMYEEYWTFGKLGKQWTVGTLSWKELPYEILLLGKGWVYRTRAEAKTALPAVAKEMGVEFIV